MNKFEKLILSNPFIRATDIKRYSGTDCIRVEDILQHTTQVMTISYILALKLSELNESIDIGRMLEKGLLHDIDESLTGDIPRPVKYYNEGVLKGARELASVSSERLVRVIYGFEDPEAIRMLTTMSRAKSDKEGLLIEIADLLTVSYKSYEELVLLGNKKFVKVAVESRAYLKELLARMYEEYSDMYSKESLTYLSDIITDAMTTLKSITDPYKDIITQLSIASYNFTNDKDLYD